MKTIEFESKDIRKATQEIMVEASKANVKKIYCNKKLHDLIKNTSNFVVANDYFKKEDNSFAIIADIIICLDENMENEISSFKL